MQNTMFDGIQDQLHQFIPSRTSTSLPLPLCTFPTTFDPYTSSHHQTLQANELFLHPLHHYHNPPPPITKNKDEEKDQCGIGLLSVDLDLERERSIPEPIDLWSHDEVFALLRVRSSMDNNWFPQEITWEHVSRRLEELGFKKSADKCKEKFEEESRAYFSSINNYKNNNYRLFSELEEICQGDENTSHVEAGPDRNESMETQNEEDKEYTNMGHAMEESSRKEIETTQVNTDSTVHHREEMVRKSAKKKKRKRHQKFEMLKGLCEGFVNKMMTKQEELQNKLLENMMRRDEENIANEEARKKQEMDRIIKEIENREREQAIASERQATIIEFLKRFTSGSQQQCLGERHIEELLKALPTNNSKPPSLQMLTTHELNNIPKDIAASVIQNPSSYSSQNNPNLPASSSETLAPHTPTSNDDPNISKFPTSSSIVLVSRNPNSLNSPKAISLELASHSAKRNPQNLSLVAISKEDYGKRWPRDEVLALINIRCSFFTNDEDKEGASKVPLWERISQRMLELGYKRSAKRCKEKWENINKYFRKTKDTNKKRSLDSRTCPYFHQLSNLYKEGKLIVPSNGPENSSPSPTNPLNPPENRHQEYSQAVPSSDNTTNMHVNAVEGEKNMQLQVPPSFDFEY